MDVSENMWIFEWRFVTLPESVSRYPPTKAGNGVGWHRGNHRMLRLNGKPFQIDPSIHLIENGCLLFTISPLNHGRHVPVKNSFSPGLFSLAAIFNLCQCWTWEETPVFHICRCASMVHVRSSQSVSWDCLQGVTWKKMDEFLHLLRYMKWNILHPLRHLTSMASTNRPPRLHQIVRYLPMSTRWSHLYCQGRGCEETYQGQMQNQKSLRCRHLIFCWRCEMFVVLIHQAFKFDFLGFADCDMENSD